MGDPTATYNRTIGQDGTSMAATDGVFAAAKGGSRFIGRFEGPLRGSDTFTVSPSGRLVVQGAGVGTSDDLGRTWHVAPIPEREVGGLRAVFSDAQHGIIVAAGTPPYSAEQPLPVGVRRGPGVLATTDGGRSWRTVIESEPIPTAPRTAGRGPGTPMARPRTNDGGPPSPRPRISVLRVLATPDGAYLRTITINRAADGDEPPAAALERSDDEGATWRRLWTLPAPPGGYAPSEVRSLGVLPSGAIVLVLTDSFNAYPKTTRPIVVLEPATGQTVDHEAPGPDPFVSCDTAGTCTLQVGDSSTGYRTATFDGETFGSPSPARPAQFAAGESTVFHDHHVVVRASAGGWSSTRDGKRATPLPPPPVTGTPTSVAQASGGLVALFEDGDAWRLREGRWTRLAALRSLKPSAVAASGTQVLVAGSHGITRISGGRQIREVRDVRGRATGITGSTRPLTPGFASLDVHGSSIIAWSAGAYGVPGKAVRSSDGGTTWRLLPALPGADDVQQLSDRTIVASRGPALLVSRDAGRTFKTAGYADTFSERGVTPTFLHFRTLRDGVLSTASGGTVITRDGGRTWQDLPRPGGSDADVARLTPNSLITDGPLGTVLYGTRPFAGVRRTSITARITNVARAKDGRVALTITGRSRGLREGSEPTVLTARPGGGPPIHQGSAYSAFYIEADGTYTAAIDVLPGRRITIQHQGEFVDRPFRASARSNPLTAPNPPRRSRGTR